MGLYWSDPDKVFFGWGVGKSGSGQRPRSGRILKYAHTLESNACEILSKANKRLRNCSLHRLSRHVGCIKEEKNIFYSIIQLPPKSFPK